MISDAISADIYITDTSGNIILCKDVITQNYSISNNGRCSLHGGYTIPQEVIDEAKKGDYFAKTTLNGVYMKAACRGGAGKGRRRNRSSRFCRGAYDGWLHKLCDEYP